MKDPVRLAQLKFMGTNVLVPENAAKRLQVKEENSECVNFQTNLGWRTARNGTYTGNNGFRYIKTQL